MFDFLQSLFSALAIPQQSLPAVFIIAFLSATLLPLGSEPVVFAVVKANLELFWPAILLATVGNSLGSVLTYWMGYGAKQVFAPNKPPHYLAWLERFGPRTMLLSFLPIIGDPLCAVAGWLKMPFWPCTFYIVISKLGRYLIMTYLLLMVPDGFWRGIVNLFGA